MNAEFASFLSAGAAVLAAVFTGINLWVTGRRQHVSWTREALEQACVDFLTAHYEHWDACARLEAIQGGEVDPSGAARDIRDSLSTSHATMMLCVTRFRVLTAPDLARAALDLREINRRRLELLDARPPVLGVTVAVDRARELRRDRFVLVVQQVLQIGSRRAGKR